MGSPLHLFKSAVLVFTNFLSTLPPSSDTYCVQMIDKHTETEDRHSSSVQKVSGHCSGVWGISSACPQVPQSKGKRGVFS